ncbi:hypothetical protein CYG49_02485 [Candidatus Saccharibacteria bacterium]|nr:MAG: hypothetical protein CYG49_02485 [Candidatus Saccharibacteria bacterium]
MREKVVVIIPCHNEEKSIATVIKKIPVKKLANHGIATEILVINNNSTDRTHEVAEAAGATVIEETKKGKGNAMCRGFASLPADTNYVVMLDGDDTYNPAEILRLIEPLQSGFCEVVIGSRLSGKMNAGAMNSTSRLGNWVFTNLVRVKHRVAVTDVLTGYFAWTKAAIDDLAPHLHSAGFAIEMEMITKMARMNYEIYSVPISYHPRIGESNLRPYHDGARIFTMFVTTFQWRPHCPTRFHTPKNYQQQNNQEQEIQEA